MNTPINELIRRLENFKRMIFKDIEAETVNQCINQAEKLKIYENDFLKKYTDESIYKYLVVNYNLKLTFEDWIKCKDNQ
jgi:hypothetical protein